MLFEKKDSAVLIPSCTQTIRCNTFYLVANYCLGILLSKNRWTGDAYVTVNPKFVNVYFTFIENILVQFIGNE